MGNDHAARRGGRRRPTLASTIFTLLAVELAEKRTPSLRVASVSVL